MKEGWTYKKLGEVCEVLNGLWKGKKPPYVNVGVIRNANFTKDFTLRYDNIEYLDVEVRQYDKRKLRKGDLIIEKSGGSDKQPVGRAVLFDKEDGDYSFSNFTSVLRINNNEEIISKFLYTYLLYIYKRGDTLSMQRATTGIHNIEFDKYLSIEIPCLTLSEQQRIVSRLDSAFAHIEERKANAEKQLSEARALFHKALTKAMEPKEGWEEKKLGEVCEINSILVDPTEEQYRNLIHVGGANIVSGTGELVDLKTAAEEGLTSGKFTFDDNDVLYNKIRPYLIKVSRPDFSGLCSADMYPLTSKGGMMRDYLYYILVSRDFTDYAILNSARAGMPKLNRQALFAYKCMIPSLSEQQRIVSRLDSLSAHIHELEDVLQKTIAECDALKQALLRQVFE